MRLERGTSGRLACALALALAMSCHSVSRDDAHHGMTAKADIVAKSGSEFRGRALFNELNGGVMVTILVENAPPGWHASHIHEVGDCSAADGSSAGGHFNPGGHAHGAPDAMEHHLGDLGNLHVADDGRGFKTLFMPGLTVADGPNSVVGRAIIVHERADDLTSQPTGAAGGRIGCGEIRR
jgi:Cu-Zn family superoxide dismutase